MFHKCHDCNGKIPLKQLLKSIFTGYSDITCSSCKSQYSIVISIRIITGLLIALPLFLLLTVRVPFKPILAISYYGCIFLLLPIIAVYKKKC